MSSKIAPVFREALKTRKANPLHLDLKSLNVAIVGGTGGLGQAISRFMAARGANVWVVGQTFRDQDTANINFIKADLGLMSEAQRVAKALPAEDLDMCIFTTGIFAASKRQVTDEGIERDLAVSFLSRLVISRDIGNRLGKNRTGSTLKPRMFIMGFPGSGELGKTEDLNQEKAYSMMTAHMNTVAGNEMLVLDAVKRFPDIRTFGLNPGLIKTGIRNNLFGEGTFTSSIIEGLISLFTPTPETYARKITALLVSSELDDQNGTMYGQDGADKAASKGMTDEVVNKFLTASEELLAAKTGK